MSHQGHKSFQILVASSKYMNFKDHTTILDDLERPFAIQVFHSQRQPLSNTDADGRHPCVAMQPCDHVSLDTNQDRLCELGMKLYNVCST